MDAPNVTHEFGYLSLKNLFGRASQKILIEIFDAYILCLLCTYAHGDHLKGNIFLMNYYSYIFCTQNPKIIE